MCKVYIERQIRESLTRQMLNTEAQLLKTIEGAPADLVRIIPRIKARDGTQNVIT